MECTQRLVFFTLNTNILQSMWRKFLKFLPHILNILVLCKILQLNILCLILVSFFSLFAIEMAVLSVLWWKKCLLKKNLSSQVWWSPGFPADHMEISDSRFITVVSARVSIPWWFLTPKHSVDILIIIKSCHQIPKAWLVESWWSDFGTPVGACRAKCKLSLG